MLIKQLLHEAFSEDDINLQALIMFLVFEKQVLSMEDCQSELKLYFLPKHNARMGEELTRYKRKMKMKDNPSCYKVFTNQGETLYTVAQNETQVKALALSLNFDPLEIKFVPSSKMTNFNGEDKPISEVMKNKNVPSLLGVNAVEQKYNWRNLP